MATEKKKNGSAHNLDFKFKIGKTNMTLRDLRSGYHSMGNSFNMAVCDLYSSLNNMKDLWSLSEVEPISENWNHSYHGVLDFHTLKNILVENNYSWTEIVAAFEKSYDMEDDANIVKKIFTQYEKGSYAPTWELRNALGSLINSAAPKTPEAKEINVAFNNWLKKRPGVKSAYETYMTTHNRDMPAEITYFDIAAVINNWDFKQLLETSRPVIFEVGSLVCLRKNFHGTYRHDPYYYCRNNAFDVPKDQMPRMGIVTELTDRCASRSRYGKGSRLLKVMWSATGETSSVSENKLIIAEKYKVGEDM